MMPRSPLLRITYAHSETARREAEFRSSWWMGGMGMILKAFAGILIGPGHPGVLLSTPNHNLLGLGHPWCAHLGSRHP